MSRRLRGRLCATGCDCAPKPRWTGSAPTASWTPCSRPSRSRAEPMALTGRLGLAALVGGFVVMLLIGAAHADPRAVLVAVNGTLLLGVLLDVALAGAVRPLVLSRGGDESTRLGEVARVDLFLDNPGRRKLRARIRDAWPPSAGAQQQRHSAVLPSGERGRVTTVLHPTRRGDRHAARVTVRSVGPLGLAGRQGSHVAPWRGRGLPALSSPQHPPGKIPPP